MGRTDIPAGRHGFVEPGGEQIYFESWGSGEAVVLGHGMGGNHVVWYQQVPALAARYQVITWDQRGFGRSHQIPCLWAGTLRWDPNSLTRTWRSHSYMARSADGVTTPADGDHRHAWCHDHTARPERLSAPTLFVVGENDPIFPPHLIQLAAALIAGSSIGGQIGDLTDILISHCHPDHLGSAAHLSAGGVPVSIHAEDAEVARAGRIEQTMSPGPGIMNRVLFRLLIGNKAAEFPRFEPQNSLHDGSTLDIAGGIEVIHTPGHTAGHVSLLWKRDDRVLFAGDVAANLMGLAYSLGYDDLEAGKASLVKLAQRDFEIAVFGHGRPIMSDASERFSRRFA